MLIEPLLEIHGRQKADKIRLTGAAESTAALCMGKRKILGK